MALTDKLTAIAEAIRAKTGESDMLTLDGMVDAINGISGGSGLTLYSGTITPAEDIDILRKTGLPGAPSAFAVAPAFSTDVAHDGKSKLLGALWIRGIWYLFRTNAGGTGPVGDSSSLYTYDNYEIKADDFKTNTTGAYALETGFLIVRSAYFFRTGLTYHWVAFV